MTTAPPLKIEDARKFVGLFILLYRFKVISYSECDKLHDVLTVRVFEYEKSIGKI